MGVYGTDGKEPYCVVAGAMLARREAAGVRICIETESFWLTAANEYERRGMVDAIHDIVFPKAQGWSGHFSHSVPIGGLYNVGPLDIAKLQPHAKPTPATGAA